MSVKTVNAPLELVRVGEGGARAEPDARVRPRERFS